jgi:hypothetical protein
VPTSDVGGEILTEHCHLFTVRRSYVSRKICLGGIVTMWSEQEELRKLACIQPWESAAVIDPAECQAPVAIEAVQAEVREVESFPSHRLHGIAIDSLYISDLYWHFQVGGTRSSISPACKSSVD